MSTLLKRFDQPDEVRVFELGKLEIVRIGGMTLGRASYEAGWKWSEHVGKAAGQASCQVAHVGLVVAGRNLVTMDDGRSFEMRAGDLFEIEPGHDSEVVGDEAYVSLHLQGVDGYARK